MNSGYREVFIVSNQSIAQFWDRYLEKLTQNSIKDELQRWHVRHIERYIAATKPLRLRQHTAATAEAYFLRLGRNQAIDDWQFAQNVTSH
jgi:hypothetical protein